MPPVQVPRIHEPKPIQQHRRWIGGGSPRFPHFAMGGQRGGPHFDLRSYPVENWRTSRLLGLAGSPDRSLADGTPASLSASPHLIRISPPFLLAWVNSGNATGEVRGWEYCIYRGEMGGGGVSTPRGRPTYCLSSPISCWCARNGFSHSAASGVAWPSRAVSSPQR